MEERHYQIIGLLGDILPDMDDPVPEIKKAMTIAMNERN
jgi:hypothetical protein